MHNLRIIQEYFQPKIGRKIRIFSLGRKNNILIKKRVYSFGVWVYLLKKFTQITCEAWQIYSQRQNSLRHFAQRHLSDVLATSKSENKASPFPPPLPHPVPTMLCSCSSYNRGQKCWELSSDFIKTSEFPLLHQTTLILSEKGRNEPFLGAQHCWERGVWDEGMKPKPIKTLIVMEQSPMQLFLV